MGTWSVTPSTDVINNNNGTFVFPRNDTGIDIDYIIKYVNDDGTCTPETTYTVAACPAPEVTCNCNDFWLEDNSPVTVGNAQGSYEIRKIRFGDGKESCLNKLNFTKDSCTYLGETWLTAVTSSITNENYVVFSALTDNPSVYNERSCVIGFNFDKASTVPCINKTIQVSQSKKSEPTETFTFNNKIQFRAIPIQPTTVVNAWFDNLDATVEIVKNGETQYSNNISPGGCPCIGCTDGTNRNPYESGLTYSVTCTRSQLTDYILKISIGANGNIAREAYSPGRDIECTSSISSVFCGVTGRSLDKVGANYVLEVPLNHTKIICNEGDCPPIMFIVYVDFN